MTNGQDARGNLTNTQFLIWLGQQLNPEAPLYNMIVTFDFEGSIDLAAFRHAFQETVDNSDALRTIIENRDGTPHQRVLPTLHYEVPCIDFSSAPNPEQSAQHWIDRQRLCLFQLDQRLFDSVLLKLNKQRYIWYLSQHHLITDGWSFLVVYNRVAECYTPSISNGPRVKSWPQFADYANHERAVRQTAAFDTADAFWLHKAQGTHEPLAFFGNVNPQNTARTERVLCDIGIERSEALRRIAREKGFATLSLDLSLYNIFTMLISAFLYRETGNTRFAIGVPFHNRATPAFKNTVGAFIEICPLQFDVSTDDSFISLNKRAAAEMLTAMRHVQPGISSAERNRAYEVLLNFVNVGFTKLAGMQPTVEWVHPGYGDRNHAVRVQIHDFDNTGSYKFLFDFNTALFNADQRQWAVQHFLHIVDALITDRTQRIGAINLQSADEHQRFVVDFNRTAAPFPAGKTVVDLFETQAGATPNAVAVECEGKTLTYRELSERTNQIAHTLIEMGVRDEQPVIVRMDHSLQVVAALFGVLKTGAAYVPIDPAYPADRLAFMLDDIARGFGTTPVLLTQPHLASDVATNAQVVVLDLAWTAIANQPVTPINHATPDNPAYIIYTSGSTGKPKGVMIEHRSLVNYIWWARNQYCANQAWTWPLFSSLSFDLTVTSIFTPLLTGGRIITYPDDPAMRGMNILRVIEDNQCDVVKLTPSHLSMLRNLNLSESRIRAFIVGGEDFKTELAAAITNAFAPREGGVALFNEYGPTEATVGCMIHHFDLERDRKLSVPIGTPAANAQIYVLDAQGNPTPTGVIGEMCISGECLARGYFNRPELTVERFVEMDATRLTFDADASNVKRQRLYRTGDLARWLPNGQLEFLGRADQQVKIGGARLELGEVEARLQMHPHILACAVVVMAPTTSNATHDVQHCARCGLESNFPGVNYDAHGVCNFCRAYDSYKDNARAYFKTLHDFAPIVAEMKALTQTRPPLISPTGRENLHDCIVLLSGGKDSTYMLYQLVGMGLKPLAFTLDNGFISAEAKANIARVVNALGVDHVYGRTPAMNAIFVDSLKTYANVCNGCFKTIYTLAANLARERGIKHIITGLSRGQFFETRLSEAVFTAPNFTPEKIDVAILEARKAYHRRDDVISRSLDVDVFRNDATFQDIQFVDFYRYCTASLAEMYAFLHEHAPWVRPSDTGRSTNCLINDVGIWLHKKKRGYHNYSLPYAWDVRLGHKTRDAAIDELKDEIDETRVRAILREIGYDEPIDNTDTPAKLAAYIVSDAPIATTELRSFLTKQLPDYMVPTVFVRLDALPLTPNGKVDRAALPHPSEARPDIATRFAEPRTDTERNITQIWQDVLGITQIGIYDNFFELGGSSLPALQIISRINRAFQIELPIPALFDHPTVAGLSESVEAIVIAELESMSDDEVKKFLAGEVASS